MTTPSPTDLAATGSEPPPASGVHSRQAALLLLVVLAIVWGVHWPVVKIGLRSMPPLTYAALRVVTGLLVMVVVVGAQGRLRLPPRADLPIIFSVGLAQIAASVLIMNLALQVVQAGRSSILYYTMPLWVAVLAFFLFRVRPSRNELAGLVLGISGVLILVNPSVIDWGNPGELAGTLALFLNASTWALVTIHIKRHHWVSSPLDLQPWVLLVSLVPLGAVALAFESGRAITWDASGVVALAYSGPLATAFAFWASQAITRSLGPIATGISFLVVPVIGLVSGAVILGEQLALADIVGFGLVLGGVAFASVVPVLRSSRAPTLR